MGRCSARRSRRFRPELHGAYPQSSAFGAERGAAFAPRGCSPADPARVPDRERVVASEAANAPALRIVTHLLHDGCGKDLREQPLNQPHRCILPVPSARGQHPATGDWISEPEHGILSMSWWEVCLERLRIDWELPVLQRQAREDAEHGRAAQEAVLPPGLERMRPMDGEIRARSRQGAIGSVPA